MAFCFRYPNLCKKKLLNFNQLTFKELSDLKALLMPNYRNVTFNWGGGGGGGGCIYWDKTVKFSLPYILYYIRFWQSLTFGPSTFKQQICWNMGLCNSMTAFSVCHVMVHSFKAQNPLTCVPHSFWNQLLPKFHYFLSHQLNSGQR